MQVSGTRRHITPENRIQCLKQNWKGLPILVQAKIKHSNEMARNARLEITGVAKQSD